MSIKIEVMEDTSLSMYDIVCPSCGTVLVEHYSGRKRFSEKCPVESFRLYEYGVVAVEPGKGEMVEIGDMRRKLKNYWDSRVYLGRGDPEEYSKMADRLGVSWYPPEE